MPAVCAKNKEDAKRKLKRKFGSDIKLSTLIYMKNATQFQHREYGKKCKWYRATFRRPR